MKNTLRFSLLFVFVMLFAVMAISASAEEVAYYYIDSEAGIDHTTGDDPNVPLRTFTEACNNAVRDGVDKAYIVVMNEYVFNGTVNEVKHPDVEFILTAKDRYTDYGSLGAKLIITGARRYYLNGNTTFENLKIERDNSLVVVAQYNHLTFGEGMEMTYTSETDKGLWVVGGYQSPEDSVDVSLDSHVTIKSGTYHRVVGGSRQNWNDKYDGLTYTGTHYIDISGGKIDILICASYAKNVSDSAVVNISGGEFRQIYLGGDATRRFDNDLTATFTGGKVTEGVFVNNIVGAADVTIAGTEMSSLELVYSTDKIKEMARQKNKTKTLFYDSHYYTDAQIEAFGAGFNKVENITTVYTANGADGSGKTESDPAAFADAFKAAVDTKAVLVVLNNMTVTDFVEPSHDAIIKVKGATEKVTLTLNGTYTFSGETVFSEIKLAGNAKLNAENGTFVAESDATVSSKFDITGSATLKTGEFGNVTNANTVIVNGATVQSITGGNTSANVEVLAGKVGNIITASESIQNFALVVSGGAIDKVTFNNVTKSLSYKLYGGTVAAYEVLGNNVKGTLQLGDGISADALGAATSLFDIDNNRVVYIANGGSGSGATPSAPVGSLKDAYTAIGNADGTIVICGEFKFSSAHVSPSHAGKILITSVYDGVDYRKTNGAKLILDANYYIGGETEFDNLHIESIKSYVGFFGNYEKLVFGKNITTSIGGSNNTYPCIVGGTDPAVLDAKDLTGEVVVNGGTWERVRLGSSKGTPVNCDVILTMNGGKVVDFIYMSSANSHSGDLTVIVNGGKLGYGIVGHGYGTNNQTYEGNLTVTVNGGEIWGRIMPRYSKFGYLKGTWTVNLNGGDFAHCAEIRGTENMGEAMTSTLNVGNGFNWNEKVSGTYTFNNPIRYYGADPWILYHNGSYYYTATGGDTLMLYKAPNIGDLSTAAGAVIYDPEDGKEWSHNMWSPEIHYFSAEQVGEEYAGWYCFVTSDDGQDWNYSSLTGYVIKCLDGDDLMGRWGNPITGEVNVPEPIVFRDTKNPEKFSWIGGMSTLEVNGENYIIFVNEYNRDTVDFYQALQIAKYENPWTIIGEPAEICVPTYDWEKVGGGDGIHPYTVECITGVYGDDGSVFVSYAGSAYWTSAYAIGCMEYLGGDPMDINNWKKSPEPIFSKSKEVNGCAHACYVTDTDGNKWAMYHAYITGSSQTGRYAFIEPYSVIKEGGLVIGNGTKQPAPLSTVYTSGLNPTPVSEKVLNFKTVNQPKFAVTREYDGRFTDVTESHWFYSFVKNAYCMSLANGTSATKFSPDNTFTVAQALTAAANIHTAYNGTSVRSAASGEAWYVPYVEYCVQNGIIKEGQFADVNANITRGDMAIVFANILPDSEYAAVVDGSNPDVTSDMACYNAVAKLYKAGIVGGDAGTGNYRPNDSIKRSEACVIFTRIAMTSQRIK
ncbi:MAG: S-layer homology domain-containing protein [Clostridia bacterium]|nr:S-layer homology domain-containing protein [Clostridia bacterium]